MGQIAGGRDDILAEAAGITAGSWYAWPSTHVGHELIIARTLIMAGGDPERLVGPASMDFNDHVGTVAADDAPAVRPNRT